MFKSLKFKRKTDSGSPGPKTEAPDSVTTATTTTTTTTTTRTATGNTPPAVTILKDSGPLPPTSPASTFSFSTSSPPSFSTSNHVTPILVNNDASLGRNDSNGSAHHYPYQQQNQNQNQLHHKTSLTSLNNFNSYSNSNANFNINNNIHNVMLSNTDGGAPPPATAAATGVAGAGNTSGESNYKVPFDSSEGRLKVAMSSSEQQHFNHDRDRDRVRSQTFNSYGAVHAPILHNNNTNSNIPNNSNSGAGGSSGMMLITPSSSAPTLTAGSEGQGNDHDPDHYANGAMDQGDDATTCSRRSSTQGPKTNLATKPAVGTFPFAAASVVTAPFSTAPNQSSIASASEFGVTNASGNNDHINNHHHHHHHHHHHLLMNNSGIDHNSNVTSIAGNTSSTINNNNFIMGNNTSAPSGNTSSASSSATPSRSSSSSNRALGGTAGGVATIGSFTPLSATPPMTPRMAHDGSTATVAGDGGFLNGGRNAPDLVGTNGGDSRPLHLHSHTHPLPHMFGQQQQQHQPSQHGLSSTATPAAAAGMNAGQYHQQHQQHQQYQTPAFHEAVSPQTTPPPIVSGEGVVDDDSVLNGSGAMAFVSSPISYQPPSNPFSAFHLSKQEAPDQQQQTLYPQDAFQFQYVPAVSHGDVISGLSGTEGADGNLQLSHSNSKQQATTTRDTALQQQQQYQQQQLAQFREDMGRNISSNSTVRTVEGVAHQQLMSPPTSSSASSPTVHMQDSSSLIAVAALAAALSTTSPTLPPTSLPTSSTAAPFSSSLASGKAESPLQRQDSPTPTSAAQPLSFSQQQQRATFDTAAPTVISHPNPPPLSQQGANGMNGGPGPVHTQGQGGFGGVLGGGSSFFPSPVTRASTSLQATHLITHDLRQTAEGSHIIDGSGPVVLMAIGKTGQGKSSLLNKIMGTSELKASASVRAVTKGIAERTGWGRFEDSRRVLVTLADTPGLADTEGDDEKNIPILKEYIRSVGTRLGVTAFLLVFKIDSGVDMILTILMTFNEIMKEFPNFWDNVVLVFTGCDYRRNVMVTKQLYHAEIQAQLQEHFFNDLKSNNGSSNGMNGAPAGSQDASASGAGGSATSEPTVPMVFLSCAEAPCGFSLGEKCDCKARTTFLNAGIKRLWYAVRNKKRWLLDLDQDEDDDLLGHS